MNKISDKIITIVFMLFLIIINILNIIIPDRYFSQVENRILAQVPKFSLNNMISGRFTNKFEEYITDQFPLRDFWVSVKSDVERFTLKTFNNGIYFGEDGYLLEDYKRTNEQLLSNINSINTFSKAMPNIKTYFLLAPNSVKIYEDKLPLFASPYNQSKTLEKVEAQLNANVNFINVYAEMVNKKNEYIYFKTDHHWTMRGAYYAYKELCNKLNLKAYSINDFNSIIIDKSFYGTFYSKASNRHILPDSIEIFTPKIKNKYKIEYIDTGKSSDSFYEYSHLNKKDKYSIFLDGNHALTTITTNIKNEKRLVIFKDSYAHSLIPFLANHYEEIHIIDLRYYKLNIYDYIKQNNINEALFLYNISSFSKDESIKYLELLF
ncbi:DHHW family protein [Clostridium grantii]|uniref:DHHW protein n=1 Tax=Clostridium grantii DSM 8605 TaxID=1121316 RepID=A0A1M5XV28_9CLOT|nr:DHHW family protein [Clostridium grantii]SHI03650.1 DHHW protein [Clostridium grantii DSM 8605]